MINKATKGNKMENKYRVDALNEQNCQTGEYCDTLKQAQKEAKAYKRNGWNVSISEMDECGEVVAEYDI